MPHECRKHGVSWYGANICHCEACGLVFGGVTPFDKHRHSDKCIDPTTDGWFVESRPGVWSQAPANGRPESSLTPSTGVSQKETSMSTTDTTTTEAPTLSPSAYRAFAADAGITVGTRGLIPATVKDAFANAPKRVQKLYLGK